MRNKNILIVGYPKSGTHWLCRLVSDLLQCPFVGDWGYETLNSSSINYDGKITEHQIYKSHHPHDEIYEASSKEIFKIIYLIRDPRDIVVSGIHFFSFSGVLPGILKRIPFSFLARVLTKFSKFFMTKEKKKKQMIQAVLYGNESITPWLKIPWEVHYKGYLDKDILFIRYEDLLHIPEKECAKILRYLKLNISSEHIKNSIDNQSFQKRLGEVSNQKNPELKKLIRKGSSGYWKEDFTSEELAFFKNSIKEPCTFYEF